jgi:hypothetical protein
MATDTPESSPERQDEPAARLPYEPPAIISEEVFETLAASCGKAGGARCQLAGGINS